jgi:hypothetical protein
MVVFLGAILLDGDVLAFSKSADFSAAPIEAEKAMYSALINLFTQALANSDAPPAADDPASVATVADHVMD